MADLYIAIKRLGKALTGQNIKGSTVAELIDNTAAKIEELNQLDEAEVKEALKADHKKK